MSKEKVAIDLDEVVLETATHVINYYEIQYGVSVALENYYQRTNRSELWGVPDEATATQQINAYLQTDKYYELEPEPETVEALKAMKDEYDFELCVVTGRPSFVEEATRRHLSRHFPETFQGIEFTNFFSADSRRDKGEICRRLGATIGIDDHPDHARSMAAAGMEVLLFGNYPWNQTDEELPNSVTRVANWRAVLEYFDGRS